MFFPTFSIFFAFSQLPNPKKRFPTFPTTFYWISTNPPESAQKITKNLPPSRQNPELRGSLKHFIHAEI
jgi:hypothetical protein